MTIEQFDNGCWYVKDLKDFAKLVGITSCFNLRKDELEKNIKYFLKTGRIDKPSNRNLKKHGLKDIEMGLSLKLPIVNYTDNRETKEFIVTESLIISPGLKKKSGVLYRLNRWREEQLSRNNKITYGDLVNQYIELSQTNDKFARIPHGRYINFIGDFMSGESNATRSGAMEAWEKLKNLDAPKTYKSWKKYTK